MTFFIKIIITCPGFFCIWFWRDCIGFAVFCNIWPNFFWTIRFIPKDIAFRDVYFFQSINRMLAVCIIPSTDQKFYRISKIVYNCMKLCVQSSTGSSDGFFCPFLKPPFVLWCAFAIVESMLKFSISASLESVWKIFSHTPSFCHFLNLA